MPEISSVVGYLSGNWALWGLTLNIFALSMTPNIAGENGYTQSALIIALCLAGCGWLLNMLSLHVGEEKKAARTTLKWIQFLFYIIAWGLVLIQLSNTANRPVATSHQTRAFWYAAYGDVFFGIAWLSVLLDLACSVAKPQPAVEVEHHGEDVQIVPVGGSQPTKKGKGWGFFWWSLLVIPPAGGLVVFSGIRGWNHSYALALDGNIIFAGSILSAILLWHLGTLYYWKAYSEKTYYPQDVYALGALLAPIIAVLLAAQTDLTLTVVLLYSLYGATAVVFLRLASHAHTKHLLFIKN